MMWIIYCIRIGLEGFIEDVWVDQGSWREACLTSNGKVKGGGRGGGGKVDGGGEGTGENFIIFRSNTLFWFTAEFFLKRCFLVSLLSLWFCCTVTLHIFNCGELFSTLMYTFKILKQSIFFQE